MKKNIYTFIFLSLNLVYSQQSPKQSSIDSLHIIGIWREEIPLSKAVTKSGLKLSENFTSFWKYDENGILTVKFPVPKINYQTNIMEADGYKTTYGTWKVIDNKLMRTFHSDKNSVTELGESEILCLDNQELRLKTYAQVLNDSIMNNYKKIKP